MTPAGGREVVGSQGKSPAARTAPRSRVERGLETVHSGPHDRHFSPYSFTDEGVTFTVSGASPQGVSLTNPPGTGTATSQGNIEFDMNRTFTLSAPGLVLDGQTEAVSVHIQGGIFTSTGFGSQLTVSFVHATNPASNVVHQVIGPLAAPISRAFTATGGVYSAVRFTSSATIPIASLELTSLTANITCFCAGTAIATPDGAVAVEDLAAGDTIATAEGGTARVRWVGQQRIAAEYLHPDRVNPIRIAAGALGGGLPARDLLVSPDHGLALDGVLVNAGSLVNGGTIRQVGIGKAFTYYHVETEAHELILAEGVEVETYLDGHGSDFDNADTRPDSGPVTEMDLPRVMSARLLPAALRQRLLAGQERAA